MIFLSSCIVLEPTLDGTILDATDLNHVIDASRIVTVRPVDDDGPGEIICAYMDSASFYDNSILALGRHSLLEFRSISRCCA